MENTPRDIVLRILYQRPYQLDIITKAAKKDSCGFVSNKEVVIDTLVRLRKEGLVDIIHTKDFAEFYSLTPIGREAFQEMHTRDYEEYISEIKSNTVKELINRSLDDPTPEAELEKLAIKARQ